MPYPHPSAFAELKALAVDVVVSLLEAGEAQDVLLRDEEALCVGAGLEFLSLPICDHGVPDAVEPVASLTRELGLRLSKGRNVAVHCFAGLGRSPLIVAALLIEHGLGADAACDRISRARGRRVPETDAQLQGLRSYERLRGIA